MGSRKISKRSQGGQAIIMLTAMVATVLVPMVGLGIDASRGYLVRLKLSSAVDGGALAAGRLIGTGANAAAQLANAQGTATQFVNANFPAKFFGASLATGSPNVCVDPGTDNTNPCNIAGAGTTVSTYKVKSISISATAIMPTLFMRILGMPNVQVSSSGLAQRRDVRVVVAVDRSSSMGAYYTGINQTPPSIQDMLLEFVDGFSGSSDYGGRDQLGFVVFGGSAILAYPSRNIATDYTDYTKFTPPDNNFKVNANGNIPGYIADLSAGSNTGTAEALYLAYMALRADAATNTSLGTQLNVIVLFTDGLPNGITAYANDPGLGKNYMMAAGSGCSDVGNGSLAASPRVSTSNNNMIGWFSQWNSFSNSAGGNVPMGLYTPMMGYAYPGFTGHGDDIDQYVKNAGQDNTVIPQMTGCNDTSPPIGKTTLSTIPTRDLYGNYTDLLNSPPPAVGGLTMPTAPGGAALYTVGNLYSNQCGSSAYNSSSTTNACQIGLASWQATAHQAWKIWNQIVWDKTSETNKVDPGPNMSQPVIFTIGFDHHADGGEAPDLALLQLIANDPSSTVHFSTRINGQAFLASDANAVGTALQEIKSEILRLSH
jgi:Flp pilus assembly protein TadG